MFKKMFVGILSFFFAGAVLADHRSNYHHPNRHHMDHHGRHFQRDLAFAAASVAVGAIVYNVVRQPVVIEQPVIEYQYVPQQRYYETRWIFNTVCQCYRQVLVEIYR